MIRGRAAAAACVLLLFVGACTRDEAPNASRPGDTDTVVSAVNRTPRDQVRDGGTLRWPLAAMPTTFNDNSVDASAETFHVASALLPSAFAVAVDGTPVLRRDYVERAEVTAERPKQVVTYTLNRRAKWSDGSSISVADYHAQWQALNGSNPALGIEAVDGYDAIENVARGKDDHEVVVTFARPFPGWPSLFSPLYPASTNTNVDAFNAGWAGQVPMSAGPFKFQAMDDAAQTITVVRDPAWWGDKAKLDRIVFRVVPVQDQLAALQRGEIDFHDIGENTDSLAEAEDMKGVDVRRAAGPYYRHLDFNGGSAVFSDVRVRRAIALAVDRGVIATSLVGPTGVRPVPLNNHILVTQQQGYRNNAGALDARDVKKAAALLDEAGWAKGEGGVRQKDGAPLAIRFVVPPEVRRSVQEAQLVQAMLKQVGVDVKIEPVASAEYFNTLAAGNFDMTAYSWIGTPFPLDATRANYTQPQGEDVQQNYSRIGSAKIDELYAQAATELDPDKARDLANQIDAELWTLVHSLTLYQRPDIVATKATLANYGAWGFATVTYEDLGFVKP